MLRHAVLFVALFGLIANAEDWPRFRGPSGSGVATDSDSIPMTWSPNANLAWKAALPGPGASSPIIVGERIFVTCYSGYGESRENLGKIENLMRHLVCIDMKTGNKVWQKDVPAAQPEDKYEGAGVPAHGYASHTPVSDGKHVYVFYGKSGVRAYDMDGNEKWYAEVGKETDPMKWGSSCSPVLHENLLIVTAAAESQSIIGFDKISGKEIWRQEAEGLDNTWGTPALVKTGDRTDLVMFVTGEVWGMDPATGKLRWHVEKATEAQHAYSSIVQEGKRVFAVTGRGGGSLAVDAGGQGAVKTVWKGRDSASYGSPVLYKGKLYSIASNVVTSIDAKTGERLDQVRIKGSMGGRGDYPSPVIVGDRMYYLNGKGQMFVFALGDKVKQESVSRVSAEEGENFWGTPAISDGRMIMRSSKNLYCVADKGETVSEEDMQLAMAKGEQQGGGQNDPMRFFKMLDTDSDGKVTMKEIEGNQQFSRMADRLKTLDKDSDGSITADEYRENIGALMRRGGGGRGGRGGGRGAYGGDKDTRPDRPQRPKSDDK